MAKTIQRNPLQFDDWVKKIDALKIGPDGIAGDFSARLVGPTPDREENSSYLGFRYSLDGATAVDLIYSNNKFQGRDLRDLAITFLNSYLHNYEALRNPQIPEQFRLFPNSKRQETSSDLVNALNPRQIEDELIADFLRQRGGSMESWGGEEGILREINGE